MKRSFTSYAVLGVMGFCALSAAGSAMSALTAMPAYAVDNMETGDGPDLTSVRAKIAAMFEGDITLKFHLAPPLLAKHDKEGRAIKREYGPWMMKAFGLLAAMKGLRGTAFDIFGYGADRRMERQLLAQYEGDLDRIARQLSPAKVEAAAALASVPSLVRGYGHVKEAAAAKASQERERLLERLEKAGREPQLQAAE